VAADGLPHLSLLLHDNPPLPITTVGSCSGGSRRRRGAGARATTPSHAAPAPHHPVTQTLPRSTQTPARAPTGMRLRPAAMRMPPQPASPRRPPACQQQQPSGGWWRSQAACCRMPWGAHAAGDASAA
jgi:hypothetical protein